MSATNTGPNGLAGDTTAAAPTVMTAQQAWLAYVANRKMPPVAIADASLNLAKYLNGLETMARAGRITAISLTDTRIMSITAAQYFADTTVIGMLPDRAFIHVAGVLAQHANAVQAGSRTRSFRVVDGSANVARWFDALNDDTKLLSIALTDTAALAITHQQFLSNTAVLARLPSSATFTVSAATTAAAATLQANARVVAFSVIDTITAAIRDGAGLSAMDKLTGVEIRDTGDQIRANLPSLTTLARLERITVTDSDQFAVTAAQYHAHAAVLARLAPGERLVVTDVAASQAKPVTDDSRVDGVTVTDTLANVGANLATLDLLAEAGTLTRITVTGTGGTLRLSAEEQTTYAEALAIMEGSFTLTAERPPVINLIWDESVALAPASFRPAVEHAARFFDGLITSPITINIEVGWGEARDTALETGLLGKAYVTTGMFRAFADYRNDLARNNTSATMQSALDNLVDPGRQVFVPGAQAKALGIMAMGDPRPDGAIGFTARPDLYTYDPDNRAVAGKVDLIGLVQHEITHALGRVSYTWGTTGFDLYRYTAPNSWAPTASGVTYFSVDGGMTNLGTFSTTGDRADWGPSMSTDVQAAYLGTGIRFTYSDPDIVALQAMGYAIDVPGAASGMAAPVTAAITDGSSAHMAFEPWPTDIAAEQAWPPPALDTVMPVVEDFAPPIHLALADADRMPQAGAALSWWQIGCPEWIAGSETT